MVTTVERTAARTCALAAAVAPFGAKEWLGREEPTVAAVVLLGGAVCLTAGYAVMREVGR